MSPQEIKAQRGFQLDLHRQRIDILLHPEKEKKEKLGTVKNEGTKEEKS